MTDFTTGGRATVRDVLVDAERRLERAGVPSPSVDASELVAFALGTTRTRLFLHDRLDPDQRVRVEQLITQRLNRVPLQHITGTAPFRRLVVSVGPGVFIPRPETELVAEAAIRFLGEFPESERVAVDLCTGSGAIALSLATEVPASERDRASSTYRCGREQPRCHACRRHNGRAECLGLPSGTVCRGRV
jgi:release factor glutamine methyltransferase